MSGLWLLRPGPTPSAGCFGQRFSKFAGAEKFGVWVWVDIIEVSHVCLSSQVASKG